MRIDKRGIECLTLAAFLGCMAVGTSALNAVTPNIPSDLSANNTAFVSTETSAFESLNAGVSGSFTLACMGEAEEEEAVPTAEVAEVEVVADGTGIDWSTKCMANVSGSVNIRAEAGAESAVVGKLFEGGSADIIEKGETWTKISSGSVEGFIANEFLVFGEEAAALAREKGSFVATVLENSIRVRDAASAEAGVLGLVGAGTKLTASSATPEAGFIPVTYKDKSGFIAQEFVSTEFELSVAKSMEEIQAEEAARKKAEAEAAAKKAKAAQQSAAQRSQNAAVEASADDLSLLAALVMCEAGNQSYECKLGIASVVMNRVRSGRYPNSVHAVIYQRGQFPPASQTGRVAAVLSSGRANASCRQAAAEAMAGVSNVGSAIGFAHAGSRAGTVIGPIVFF